MKEIVEFIVQFVGGWGYLGIFLMMFLESSFFPFPSEVVMIPAGYLVHQGEMNAALAFVFGVMGSLCGALLNYWIAFKMGRGFILRYGKYVFFSEKSMQKMEDFFLKHGHISTFVGRLIPAVRQYISFPAGLCKMDLKRFCIFTSLGAGIWVGILMWIGYSLGLVFDNLDSKHLFGSEASGWITSQIHQWIIYALIFLLLLIVAYVFFKRVKRSKTQ